MRREMLYQGDRFHNLVRWGIAVNDPDLLSNGFIISRSTLLPVPQIEQTASINIRQNPGY